MRAIVPNYFFFFYPSFIVMEMDSFEGVVWSMSIIPAVRRLRQTGGSLDVQGQSRPHSETQSQKDHNRAKGISLLHTRADAFLELHGTDAWRLCLTHPLISTALAIKSA